MHPAAANGANGWEGPTRREREFERVGRGLGGQAGDKCQLNESQSGHGILFLVACLRCLPHNAAFLSGPFINCSRRVNRRPAARSWPFLFLWAVFYSFSIFHCFHPWRFSLFFLLCLVPTGERTACRSITRTAAAPHAVYKNAVR